mgnify:CR=1 FL=1
MLGVLSMPEFDKGELHIHTDVKDIEKVYAMNQIGWLEPGYTGITVSFSFRSG